jgi:hypothetical protein
MADTYLSTNYRDLTVFWKPELDGGGQTFGQDFLPVVRELFGRVSHVYEACAGCGFIGFSLLAEGLCERLTLSDINPRSVEAMRETVSRNGLEDKVEVHLADGLDALPRASVFNLVVSNPPWYDVDGGSLIAGDPGWAFHRSFYAGIRDYLAPAASVLVQENSGGAEPEVFAPMLAAGGLTQIQALRYSSASNPGNYFLWSKALPSGLVARELAAPEPLVLELSPNARPIDLKARVWYRGTIVNKFDHRVELHLPEELGSLCIPLEAASTSPLPSFLLPSGEHRLRDGLTDSLLARIRVR